MTVTVNDGDLDLEKLLRGEYEYTRFSSETLRECAVPDFSYNILNRYQKLYSPVVDQTHLAADGKKPSWPDNAPFAVCLTHDMDHVSAYSWRQSLRKGLLRARMRFQRRDKPKGNLKETGVTSALKSVAGAVLDSVSAATNRGPDPYHNYEKWLALEEKYDAKSTFFVPPERTSIPHISDPEYRYDDKVVFDDQVRTVGEMIARIDDRGWEIGLHPSWYAYDDKSALQRQKRRLEKFVDGEVRSVRQHYLHYDPRQTPRAHSKAGFEYDSTLGFNRNVGFRYDSSYPWPLYDLNTGRSLELFEIPMAIQDSALLRSRGLDLDSDTAFRYVEILSDRVAETGGVLTLSWHPSAVARPEWFTLYKRALKHLADRGAWFASVGEVGDWWRKQGPEEFEIA